MAVHSRSATTDIVASGFNPMLKNERAPSRIATTIASVNYLVFAANFKNFVSADNFGEVSECVFYE